MDRRTAAHVFTGVGFGICVGFFLRGRLHTTNFTSLKQAVKPKRSHPQSYVARRDGELKLVIVVRQDLKMRKGKVAAQCCHAAVLAYKRLLESDQQMLKQWESAGQPKVVVKCNTEDEFRSVYSKAKDLGINTNVVQDAGRTQVMPGSETVLAVGPAAEDKVAAVTGHLKLF